METNRKRLITFGLLALLAIPAMSGCVLTGTGQGIENIEEMEEADYQRFRMYLRLSVKILAERLLVEEVVTSDELDNVATVIALAGHAPITGAIDSLIADTLTDSGFTGSEIMLIAVLIDDQLFGEGRFGTFVSPDGTLFLSDRTAELLLDVGISIAEVSVGKSVTDAETQQHKNLSTQFRTGVRE